MTTAPNISMKEARSAKPGELLLGEDWVSPEVVADTALREGRGRRGIVSLNRSPLARKIIVFNLMALVILVAGVLFMNPFRDSLVLQREQGLVTEAQLIANVVETAVAATAGQLPNNINEMGIGPGVEAFLFDPAGGLVSHGIGAARESNLAARDDRQTIITDFLTSIWISARHRVIYWALGIGLALGYVFAVVAPEYDILLTGVIGGTAAWWGERALRRREAAR